MSWKNFKLSEFACKHCGKNEMKPEFIDKLQRLRDSVGFPMVVNSGYRCPVHNQKVSTTGPTGPHTTGRAVDLGVSQQKALGVLMAAINSGEFTGYGIQQKGSSRFIHLDDLTLPSHPRPTIWSY